MSSVKFAGLRFNKLNKMEQFILWNFKFEGTNLYIRDHSLKSAKVQWASFRAKQRTRIVASDLQTEGGNSIPKIKCCLSNASFIP